MYLTSYMYLRISTPDLSILMLRKIYWLVSFSSFSSFREEKHNQKEYDNVLLRLHTFCFKNLCKRIEIHYLISHSLRFKSNIAFSIKYTFKLNSLEHYLDILCNLVYSTNLLTTEAWHRKLGIKCSSRVFYSAAFGVFMP